MVSPALFGAAYTKQQREKVPPTTAQCIVFPEESGLFNYRHYSPAMTGGKATLEEIRHALRQIQYATSSSRSWIKCNAFCAFLMVLITVIFMFGMYSQNNKDGVTACTLAVITEVFVCVAFQLCLSCKVKAECQEALKKVNQSFLPKGLRWNMPRYFPKWIELRIGVPINQQIFVSTVHPQPYLQSFSSPMMNQGIDREAQNMYIPPSGGPL